MVRSSQTAIGTSAADGISMEAGTSCLIYSEPLDEVTEQWIAVKVNHLLITGNVGIATVSFDPVL